MAYPGGIDVVYDTIGKKETFEIGVRVLRARGTLVKAGVHGPTMWEDTPLYFKEISMVGSNAFGVEEIDGVRQHGIRHYLDLVAADRVDLTGMLTHTFTLDDWRGAFTALASQATSGAIKVAFDFRDLTESSNHTDLPFPSATSVPHASASADRINIPRPPTPVLPKTPGTGVAELVSVTATRTRRASIRQQTSTSLAACTIEFVTNSLVNSAATSSRSSTPQSCSRSRTSRRARRGASLDAGKWRNEI
jgi:hypothetical protein